jgi:monothiol glutaredoxin
MTKEEILKDIQANRIVLYMKGTKEQPACGFSSVIVQILKKFNLDFVSRNVLEDDVLRKNIKEFTNWPTLPQLYIDGEFIGGCDIVRDLYSSGKLEEILKK